MLVYAYSNPIRLTEQNLHGPSTQDSWLSVAVLYLAVSAAQLGRKWSHSTLPFEANGLFMTALSESVWFRPS